MVIPPQCGMIMSERCGLLGWQFSKLLPRKLVCINCNLHPTTHTDTQVYKNTNCF